MKEENDIIKPNDNEIDANNRECIQIMEEYYGKIYTIF